MSQKYCENVLKRKKKIPFKIRYTLSASSASVSFQYAERADSLRFSGYLLHGSAVLQYLELYIVKLHESLFEWLSAKCFMGP